MSHDKQLERMEEATDTVPLTQKTPEKPVQRNESRSQTVAGQQGQERQKALPDRAGHKLGDNPPSE
jgi:hypothetical protein